MTTETTTYETVARDADIDPEAFEAFCLNQHIKTEECADYVEAFTDGYIGQFESEADYAEYYYNETTNLFRLPSVLIRHIDWQGVWDSELRHDFYETDGYYFRN